MEAGVTESFGHNISPAADEAILERTSARPRKCPMLATEAAAEAGKARDPVRWPKQASDAVSCIFSRRTSLLAIHLHACERKTQRGRLYGPHTRPASR